MDADVSKPSASEGLLSTNSKLGVFVAGKGTWVVTGVDGSEASSSNFRYTTTGLLVIRNFRVVTFKPTLG